MDNKVHLLVLKPVSDVETAEFFVVKFVEELVSGPAERPNNNGFAAVVLLQVPATLGKVFVNSV